MFCFIVSQDSHLIFVELDSDGIYKNKSEINNITEY
jgi:hypothetical protein